jgi:hypothetical protein
MPDPRTKLYKALSEKYDLGTIEEFNSKMDNKESRGKLYTSVSKDFDLGSLQDFENKVAPLKKKESSISPDQKLASKPKDGSSGGVETNKQLSSPSKYKEGSMAWNHEKLKEHSKDYVAVNDRLAAVSKVDDAKKTELRKAIDDEENDGQWTDYLREGAKKTGSVIGGYLNDMVVKPVNQALTVFGKTTYEDIENNKGIIPLIDDTYKKKVPFEAEKKAAELEFRNKALQAKARKEKIPVFTKEDIHNRAKEIKLDKLVKSQSNTQVTEFLKQDEDNDNGDVERNKNLIFNVGEYATIKEDEKIILQKQNIQRPAIESMLGELNTIKKRANEIAQQGRAIPEELRVELETKNAKYKSMVSDAIKTQEEYVSNRKDLGAVSENIDVFKRDYGWFKNFVGSMDATIGDLSAGVMGALDYGSVLGKNTPDEFIRNISRGVSQDLKADATETRSEIMKPLSVENINDLNDFGQWLSHTVGASQVPIFGLIATGGFGVGAIGVSSTGTKYEDMRDETDSGQAHYSDTEMALHPLGYGVTETASAMVDLMILKNAGRVLASATAPERAMIAQGITRNILNSGTKTATGTIKGGVYEGIDEGMTKGFQNLIDGKPFAEDIMDPIAAGAVMGALIPFSANIVAEAMKPYSTDAKIQKASAEILRLQKELDNKDLSVETKTIIQENLDKSKLNVESLLKKQIGNIESLSKEQFSEIQSLEKAQANIRNQAKEIEFEGHLKPDMKKQILGNLKSEFDANNQRRLDLLERGANVQLERLDDKEVIRLKDLASRELMQEQNPDGTRNITINDDEIAKRAIQINNKEVVAHANTAPTPVVNENPIPPAPEGYNIVDEPQQEPQPAVEQIAPDTQEPNVDVASAPSVSQPLSEEEKTKVKDKILNKSRVLLRSGKVGTDAFFALPNEGIFGDVVDKVGTDENVTAYRYPKDFKIKDLSDEVVFDDYMSNKMFEGIKEEGYDAAYVMEIDGSKVLHVINPEKLTLLDKKLPELRNNEAAQKPNTPVDGDVRPAIEPNVPQGENEAVQEAVDDSGSKEEVEVKQKQYKASESGKPFNVIFEGDRLKITDENGKEPSAPTRRIIEAKYAEDFDFTQGEVAPYALVDNVERHVADNSNNPAEIASTILNFDNTNLVENNIGYKESIIADNIGRIKEEGYNRNGDRNNVSRNIKRNYFAKDGASIDVLAQEMSEQSGVEITEQDIVDFIDENPNGVKDFFKRISNEKLQPIRDLKAKFTKLTGLPASDKNLIKAIEQQVKKDNLEEDYSVTEEMSDTEMNDYFNQREQFENETNGTAEKNNEANVGSAAGANEIGNSEEDAVESEIQGNDNAENNGEKPTAEPGGIDLKSTPDQILEWLENAERNLDAFGRENLSVGIPIVIAKTAIQAMRVAVKSGKLASEVIQAGLDAVKQSQWFQNLTKIEQDSIENDFQTNFLNKINAIDKNNERQAENLLNRSLSENISEDDAYDEVRATFDSARTELANKKTFKEYAKEAYRNFVKRFTDRQYLAKSLLNKSGMKKVQNLIINAHGTSGRAKIHFEEAYNKIYKTLTAKERNTLDEIIQAKRFIAIDTNREARGLEPVSHPNFIDKNKSEKFLSKLEKELGTEKYNDLAKRAEAYFDTYKGLLKSMLDNGLISQESFDSMSDVDYQPRVFLQFVTDFNGDLETAKKTNNLGTGGLSSDQIKSMSEGDANSLVLNSEWLLMNSLLSRSKAMAMNNINKRFMTDEFQKAKARFDKLDPKNLKGDDVRFHKYFKELSSKVIDNPIIGHTENGNAKYKYDKTPPNFGKAYYYVGGQQHQFFLENELHESWNDNIGGFLSSDAKEFISYASGAALMKAIATGNNPAFPIVNTPRDFLFTATFSDQYSKIVPKAMIQVAKDVAKSIKEIRKPQSDVLKKYIEYGGAMDFLSSQGTLKKESVIGRALDKAVSANTRDIAKSVFSKVTLHKISQYSEMMFRLGIFQRSIKNQLDELGLKDISEVTDKQQFDDIHNQAVASARSILDFNQGGSITKDLESVIPYINVAFQGGRVAATAFERDPVGTTSRVLQVATLASAVPIGMSLALISAMKSDDDEDKSAYDIYLHAMEGVSRYQKMKYMNIVTGKKNEEGEYQVLKIAKAQELSPVMSITDDIYNNFIRKIAGKEKKTALRITEDALFTFNSNVMPIDATSPAGLITRTPVIKATLTYATGYDFFREEPLSMDIGKVPKPVEGITMSGTEDFYKKLGENYGLSPIRSKAFVESLITGPSTNPFIGMLYGGADAAVSDKDMKQIGSELFETVYKSTGKRVVGYSSDFNRQLSAKADLQDKIDKVKIDNYKMKAEFNELAKEFIDKKISKADLNSKLKELEPNDRKRMINKIQDKIKLKDIDGTVLDIKYEKEAEVKALMIMHYYGDIYDGSKDSKKILRQMNKAGGVLTKTVNYEYHKLKKALNKKTPN